MAKQTFTTGSVLTATQMNNLQANDYNWTVSQKVASYVLVAADKGTRIEMNAAGATTITVNNSLFAAGDTLFIQNIGAGVCTITAGTATVSKASNASLALAQYQGGYLYFISASAAVFFADAGFTSPLTTKGDLFTWDTGNQRLAVGTNGQVLTAQSAQATGLQWATLATAPTGFSLLNAGGTALTGAATVTVNIATPQKQLLVLVDGASSANASAKIAIRVNGITSADYTVYGASNTNASTYNMGNYDYSNSYSASTAIDLALMTAAADTMGGYCFINQADQTGWKMYQSLGATRGNGGTQFISSGFIEMSAAVTSVSVFSFSGNLDAGTVYVMGGN